MLRIVALGNKERYKKGNIPGLIDEALKLGLSRLLQLLIPI